MDLKNKKFDDAYGDDARATEDSITDDMDMHEDDEPTEAEMLRSCGFEPDSWAGGFAANH